VLVLVGLLAALAVLVPRGVRMLRRPLPEAERERAAVRADENAPAADRQIAVKLFFQAADRRGLAVEDREVAFSNDLTRQVRLVVEELIKGPGNGLGPTLPAETKVREVFVSPKGVAYVDLSQDVARVTPGGSEAEMITVYSLVNTLTANFPALRRVQILVEDRPVPTLAGHIDVSRPLPPDMTLLAGAAPGGRASGGAQ
jgi:spore germination protein GerM